MAKEIINEEFELPEHLQEENDDSIEVDIVDDTPEEDRGRPQLTSEESDFQEEELENYSDKVQRRIKQLSHKFHDERREKERLAREHAEAIRIAQSLLAENERIQQTMSAGLEDYAKTKQAQLDLEQRLAEDKYRKAYESGDTEGVIAANKELSALAVRKDRADAMVYQAENTPVQYEQPLQQQNTAVYSNQTAPQESTRTPDPKAEDWAARNPWFGKDEEMTSLAYGLHQKLVDRKSTRLNSSHTDISRMPSSA